MRLRLANAPVSWGVDYADAPGNPPWRRVLDQIAAAGFRWTELGPLGYLPEDHGRLRGDLDERSLRLAAGFLFDQLHDPAERPRLIETTHRVAGLVSAVGGSHLVLIDHLVDERTAVAGRPKLGRRLDPDELPALTATIAQIAQIAADCYGLRSVIHPHVGTYIEHRDEIDRVLDAVDDRLVGLCIDTGHSLYAGIDPAGLLRELANRTSYLHLKDVAPAVLKTTTALGAPFEQAVASGVFCPLGQGVLEIDSLHGALKATRFEGLATVEQDIDPSGKQDALTHARTSREFLEAAGLVEPVTT